MRSRISAHADAGNDGQGPGPITVPVRRSLHQFAVVWVVATFFLIALGGTVTSKGVGLSVPDWPTTFGYPMFSVPWSMWIGRGGVFWEHAHRLVGSIVGVMTLVMAAWLWCSQAHRRWLRWLGVAAVALVIVQGVMGGLRVTAGSTGLAIFHGVTAQLFLCVTVLIAAATGRLWGCSNKDRSERFGIGLRRLGLGLIAVMLFQLVLGASMRHTGARLAIPDFPSAYGRWVPPMNQAAIQAAIDEQPYEQFNQYYTATQVIVHFAHRLCAVAVAAVVIWFATKLSVEAGVDRRLMVPLAALGGLLLAQLALGAMVIWTGGSDGNNELATLHQANGAALLAIVSLLVIRIHVLGRMPIDRSSRSAVNLNVEGAA